MCPPYGLAYMLNMCLPPLHQSVERMLSVGPETIPDVPIKSLAAAAEQDTFRLTLSKHDNDCHVRVWRRIGNPKE